MKNLLFEIKKHSKNRFERDFEIRGSQVAPNGKLKHWELLNELEKAAETPFKLLETVAPQYQKQTRNVQLQIFKMPELGEHLQIEGRFYPDSNRGIILKLFARVVRQNRKACKVAVAKYRFVAIHYNQINAA